MSSAVVDQNLFIQPSSYSAYVEELPNIPELSIWVKRAQLDAVLPYTLKDDDSLLSSVVSSGSTTTLTKAEKIEIIKNAQATLRADMQDMDPGIRQLVSKNFKSLLWN